LGLNKPYPLQVYKTYETLTHINLSVTTRYNTQWHAQYETEVLKEIGSIGLCIFGWYFMYG